jgi:drug/metabolite transporter (DMT)-like permease
MRARLIAAFAAVYLVWGSTYLAIRFAVETLPPLIMAGSRFVMSGLILLAWARWREDAPSPSRIDWRTGLISGALLLLGGNGAVAWAEQRVPSGIAALLVAIVPLWMVVLEWARPGGRKPALTVFIGVTLGLVGLLVLVGPDALRGGGADSIGALALVLASLSWAAGSLYTKWAPRASSGTVAAGTQMLAGGALLLLAGVTLGEAAHLDLARVSTRSLLGFIYLVTFGSLIGFTAYLYLLAHTTAAKAATYAYVNPVVAVLLGWAIGHEPVTKRTLLAAAVILAGVAIITITRDAAPSVALSDAGETRLRERA